jgi:NitT/TauT family transport system ATP-binding protein
MSTTAVTDCAVSLRAVGKSYANGVVALDRLDLDVRSGEFVSLLGPSGCGKSTALRIIAGLSEPTGGEVVWPRSDASRSERQIGFVFQEPTLMPWTTVAGNVRLPLDLQRIDAAAAAPRVADEPFAALDEITRFKLNDDLLSLWESLRKTVVFVTHSVFESVYLSSRIVVMTPRPGRVFTELAIDAPYPRDHRFRTSAEYGALCRQASEALAAATEAKPEAKA